MITYIIIKMHCKRRVQKQDFQASLKRPQRAHGPLEDPTALLQRPTARC